MSVVYRGKNRLNKVKNEHSREILSMEANQLFIFIFLLGLLLFWLVKKEIDERNKIDNKKQLDIYSKETLKILKKAAIDDLTASEKEGDKKVKQKVSSANLLPSLTLLEATDIAMQICREIDNDSLLEYSKFLEGYSESNNLLSEFNNSLKVNYEQAVEAKLLLQNGVISNKEKQEIQLTSDVKRCMEIGLNHLKKTFTQDRSLSADNLKSEIKKTHSWEDLKDKF